jgi:hypothetical protein
MAQKTGTLDVVAILPVGGIFDAVYALGIERSCRAVGCTLERIDPEFSRPGQLHAVRRQLQKASVIVADISARNPHVMFLAGLAQGLGRRLILISQHGEDLPFAPADQRVIVYARDFEFLRTELAKTLRGEPAHPGTSSEASAADAEPGSARHKFMSAFGDLLAEFNHEHTGAIDWEDEKTLVLRDQDMDLPLVQALARRSKAIGLRIKLM